MESSEAHRPDRLLLEGRPAGIYYRGKTGKNAKKGDIHVSPPGDATSSCYLGKARHSLGDGAMEKGASASALSSTSGDEIVGSPFLEVRLHTHLFIFYHFYGRESSPGSP